MGCVYQVRQEVLNCCWYNPKTSPQHTQCLVVFASSVSRRVFSIRIQHFFNPCNMTSVIYVSVQLRHVKANSRHCAAPQSHSLRLCTCQPDPAVFGSMSRLLRGQTFLDVSKAIRELACMAGSRQKYSTTSTKHSATRHPCRIFWRSQVIRRCSFVFSFGHVMLYVKLNNVFVMVQHLF